METIAFPIPATIGIVLEYSYPKPLKYLKWLLELPDLDFVDLCNILNN